MQIIYILFFSLLSIAAFAQDNNTVQWKVESIQKDKGTVQLVMTATVKKGWYVYSQYLESDDGPVKTSIELEENKSITKIDTALEQGDKIEGYDALFDMKITKYKNQLKITQTLQVNQATTVKGFVTYMSCNDEMCLPPTDFHFEIALKK